MSDRCKFCGKTLRCIGGWHYPVYEQCDCGGYERQLAAERRVEHDFAERVKIENKLGGCTCGKGDYFECPMHGSRNRAMMSCR